MWLDLGTKRSAIDHLAELVNVRARIVYFNSNGNENCDVSHGTWLKENFNHVDFEIGMERTLVLGVMEDSEWVRGISEVPASGER